MVGRLSIGRLDRSGRLDLPERLDLMRSIGARGASIALAGAEHRAGEGISYRRLTDAAGGWVERFREYGLTPGSRIAVQAENSAVLAAFLYGVWCAGLFPLLQSPLLPVPRARAMVAELRCGPPFTDADLDLPSGSARGEPLDPGAPATALLTSGSTGSPRAVVHSLANHLYSAAGSAVNLPLDRDDRWLVALPLSHVSGLSILFRCLLAGATALIARSGSFRSDERGADDAWELLPQATRLSVVPAQLRRLIEAPAELRCGLRSVLVGGQAAPPALLARARDAGIPVLPTYGCTEMASQVATAAPGAVPPPGASGAALPHRRLRIRGGRIEVGGGTLFSGYLTAGGVEPPPLAPGGWFRTGDCGHLDAGGVLTVTGRADGMFVSGGENVAPQEIEETLGAHPAVTLAVVVPAPDPEFGFRPVAFVETAGVPLPVDELQALVAARLPRFRHPVRYLPMPAGAVTPAGKPDRARLAEIART